MSSKTRILQGMPTTKEAPFWDMTPYFPSLDSPEFARAMTDVESESKSIDAMMKENDIHRDSPVGSDDVQKFEAIAGRLQEFSSRFEVISSYIYAFVTTDSGDEAAQKMLGRIEPTYARLGKQVQSMLSWLGTRNSGELLAKSDLAKELEFVVKRSAIVAKHSMSPVEEELASELSVTGADAFSRLHGDVTSQMEVRFEVNGQERTEPMPVVRALAYDVDATVRKAAYEAELKAWKSVETSCAAAMNAIKGQVLLLSKKRGWDSPLQAACHSAHIDEKTLDTMIGAAKASFPELRKYMKAKAKMLGHSGSLPWYDMFAPIGGDTRQWSWEEGSEFVVEMFGQYSPKMAQFAHRAIAEHWIDAAPRPRKRDGAFCMGTRGDESRILQTWKNSFGAVSTLAHELGHGFHNLCLSHRLDFQRWTPMTLAETASIFCEQIVCNGALERANEAERLSLLEQSLQRDVQVVVDITSRFLFEQRVFDARDGATLSANDFCEIMLQAQEETYGDGLSTERHGYMWAVKPHYYSTSSYYNFPYMFGLLFSMGLYAKFREQPEGFADKYELLLSSTGMDEAAPLAAQFGFDIQKSAFWEGSLNEIIRQVHEFESLA